MRTWLAILVAAALWVMPALSIAHDDEGSHAAMELFMLEGTPSAAILKKACPMYLAGGEQREGVITYFSLHNAEEPSFAVIFLYCQLFDSHGYLD
jgi:hypothetical protein